MVAHLRIQLVLLLLTSHVFARREPSNRTAGQRLGVWRIPTVHAPGVATRAVGPALRLSRVAVQRPQVEVVVKLWWHSWHSIRPGLRHRDRRLPVEGLL